MQNSEARSLQYISLFSGGFGLDLGMESAGFQVAACVEIAPAMRQTIRYNRPNVTVIGDLPDEAGGDLYRIPTPLILERAGLKAGEADLVVGGPPCQSFSILGDRKGFNDPRGSLMLEFVRVVAEAQPRCFVMENVAGLLTLHKGAAYKQIESALRRAGSKGRKENYPYFYKWVLNAVDYGVPQIRERVFLVGFRYDALSDTGLVQQLQAPPKTHHPPNTAITLFPDFDGPSETLPEYRRVEDVLRSVPRDLSNNELRPHGERVRSRYAMVLPGTRDRVDHTDRLRWDKPSGTVLVGSGGGGGRPFIHPEEPRHLTVRESARLQSFPDDWVFCGTQTDQYRQVGNAVPPLLAAAVAQVIKPLLADIAEPVIIEKRRA